MRGMRGRVLAVWAMIALAGLVGAGSLAVRDRPPERGRAQDAVPRLRTAAQQLAHARRLKLAMRAVEKGERGAWLDRVVRAYDAVHRYHPRARACRAEAAFRAAELLRAAKRDDDARKRFRSAYQLGAGTQYRARGMLEIGHLHRRARDLNRALDAYLTVTRDARSRASHRDDGWLWAGRAWEEKGRVEEARRAWRGVAAGAEDPLDRVKAYDYIATSWVDARDLEAAAGVLNECLVALSEAALEETRSGERVRNALLRMRVVEALQREIAARKKVKGLAR